MSKLLKIVIVVSVILVIAGYSIFYYIFSNVTWKLSGFNFAPENFTSQQTGLIGEMVKIAESLDVGLDIKNGTSIPLKLTNFRLKIANLEGKKIGSIQVIRSISIPANGSAIINFKVENINESALLSDLLAGKLKMYKYTVSGMLGGILPFKYSDNVL